MPSTPGSLLTTFGSLWSNATGGGAASPQQASATAASPTRTPHGVDSTAHSHPVEQISKAFEESSPAVAGERSWQLDSELPPSLLEMDSVAESERELGSIDDSSLLPLSLDESFEPHLFQWLSAADEVPSEEDPSRISLATQPTLRSLDTTADRTTSSIFSLPSGEYFLEAVSSFESYASSANSRMSPVDAVREHSARVRDALRLMREVAAARAAAAEESTISSVHLAPASPASPTHRGRDSPRSTERAGATILFTPIRTDVEELDLLSPIEFITQDDEPVDHVTSVGTPGGLTPPPQLFPPATPRPNLSLSFPRLPTHTPRPIVMVPKYYVPPENIFAETFEFTDIDTDSSRGTPTADSSPYIVGRSPPVGQSLSGRRRVKFSERSQPTSDAVSSFRSSFAADSGSLLPEGWQDSTSFLPTHRTASTYSELPELFNESSIPLVASTESGSENYDLENESMPAKFSQNIDTISFPGYNISAIHEKLGQHRQYILDESQPRLLADSQVTESQSGNATSPTSTERRRGSGRGRMGGTPDSARGYRRDTFDLPSPRRYEHGRGASTPARSPHMDLTPSQAAHAQRVQWERRAARARRAGEPVPVSSTPKRNLTQRRRLEFSLSADPDNSLLDDQNVVLVEDLNRSLNSTNQTNLINTSLEREIQISQSHDTEGTNGGLESVKFKFSNLGKPFAPQRNLNRTPMLADETAGSAYRFFDTSDFANEIDTFETLPTSTLSKFDTASILRLVDSFETVDDTTQSIPRDEFRTSYGKHSVHQTNISDESQPQLQDDSQVTESYLSAPTSPYRKLSFRHTNISDESQPQLLDDSEVTQSHLDVATSSYRQSIDRQTNIWDESQRQLPDNSQVTESHLGVATTPTSMGRRRGRMHGTPESAHGYRRDTFDLPSPRRYEHGRGASTPARSPHMDLTPSQAAHAQRVQWERRAARARRAGEPVPVSSTPKRNLTQRRRLEFSLSADPDNSLLDDQNVVLVEDLNRSLNSTNQTNLINTSAVREIQISQSHDTEGTNGGLETVKFTFSNLGKPFAPQRNLNRTPMLADETAGSAYRFFDTSDFANEIDTFETLPTSTFSKFDTASLHRLVDSFELVDDTIQSIPRDEFGTSYGKHSVHQTNISDESQPQLQDDSQVTESYLSAPTSPYRKLSFRQTNISDESQPQLQDNSQVTESHLGVVTTPTSMGRRRERMHGTPESAHGYRRDTFDLPSPRRYEHGRRASTPARSPHMDLTPSQAAHAQRVQWERRAARARRAGEPVPVSSTPKRNLTQRRRLEFSLSADPDTSLLDDQNVVLVEDLNRSLNSTNQTNLINTSLGREVQISQSHDTEGTNRGLESVKYTFSNSGKPFAPQRNLNRTPMLADETAGSAYRFFDTSDFANQIDTFETLPTSTSSKFDTASLLRLVDSFESVDDTTQSNTRDEFRTSYGKHSVHQTNISDESQPQLQDDSQVTESHLSVSTSPYRKLSFRQTNISDESQPQLQDDSQVTKSHLNVATSPYRQSIDRQTNIWDESQRQLQDNSQLTESHLSVVTTPTSMGRRRGRMHGTPESADGYRRDTFDLPSPRRYEHGRGASTPARSPHMDLTPSQAAHAQRVQWERRAARARRAGEPVPVSSTPKRNITQRRRLEFSLSADPDTSLLDNQNVVLVEDLNRSLNSTNQTNLINTSLGREVQISQSHDTEGTNRGLESVKYTFSNSGKPFAPQRNLNRTPMLADETAGSAYRFFDTSDFANEIDTFETLPTSTSSKFDTASLLRLVDSFESVDDTTQSNTRDEFRTSYGKHSVHQTNISNESQPQLQDDSQVSESHLGVSTSPTSMDRRSTSAMRGTPESTRGYRREDTFDLPSFRRYEPRRGASPPAWSRHTYLTPSQAAHAQRVYWQRRAARARRAGESGSDLDTSMLDDQRLEDIDGGGSFNFTDQYYSNT